MRMIVFGLVLISPPFVKKLLLKWFCKGQFGKHASIGWFSALCGNKISMGEYSVVKPFTLINLSGDIQFDAYSEISSFCLIYGSSSLSVGEGSYVGPQSLINVEENVVIGKQSAIGARGMIFTHGSFLPYTEGYFIKLDGVTLGDRVWCAAGVFISPGVSIGSNTFVNSGAVVTQSISENSIAEGNPAKIIYPMDRVKRVMSPRHVDLALERILQEYAELCLKREFKIEMERTTRSELQFAWKGKYYRIKIISSKGDIEARETVNPYRDILIVNRPNYTPAKMDIILDLQTMQTPFGQDPIQESLRIFMLRYFGLRFRDKDV
jgi:acetyltransferase-like isoleucine patch superfamily enzyme